MPRTSSARIFPAIDAATLAFLAGIALPAATLRGGEITLNDRHFVLPDGFTIELVAAAPLVERPIEADFDEAGRLYVTDSSGTSENVRSQLETRPHRIRRLEDTDGDGRYDRSVLFAEDMMFPEGALWYDGSLYVAAPPSIWKLTDHDGDGVSDERVEWFEGKTLTGCANDLHGPYAGPDGRIYWAKGAFAEQTYERPGRPPFVTRAAHIFRALPDGSDIEPVMTGGMDNPVAVVFSPAGERFFTTTFLQHPGGGRRDGLIHALYGGVYGKVHSVIEEHPRTGDILPVLTHLGAAVPCGLVRYRSTELGETFQGNLFATLFNLHKVTRHELSPSGASFSSVDSDFVVCAETDFHPTDVLEDADGSLLVLDTGGWYKVCCPSSQLAKPDVLGAIYRIRRTGAHGVEDPRGMRLRWDAPPSELAGRLADARPVVRDRVAARLAAMGTTAVSALAHVAKESKDADARRRAVWALTRIDDPPARAAVRGALEDPSADVRHAALHSVALRRDLEALTAVLDALDEESPALRRVAAEAAGRIESAAAVEALLAACAAAGDDRALEHSLTYALIEIGDAEATREGLAASAPGTRRAALFALDQMREGTLAASDVASALLAEDTAVSGAARWIAERRPAWAAALRDTLEELLARASDGAVDGGAVESLLASLAHEGSVQELLAEALTAEATSAATRGLVLRTIAAARTANAPARWKDALADIVSGGDAGLRELGLAAARSLQLEQNDSGPLHEALLRVARDSAVGTPPRLDALEALPGGRSLPDDLFAFLAGALDPGAPALTRSRAARCLARFSLSDVQRRALLDVVASAGPLEITALVEPFGKVEDADLARDYVDALARAPGRRALGREALEKWLEEAPAAAHEPGRALLASFAASTAEQRETLERLAEKVQTGHPRRGQALFNGEKAACATCHRIGYLGGDVGPDLTNIGKIRTAIDLLESIVYPSVTFVRSYEPFVVVTKRGEAHTGVLRDQNASEVVLATGPDAIVRIARQDILELEPGTVSVMPAGLEEQLTEQELADIVAFLGGARW